MKEELKKALDQWMQEVQDGQFNWEEDEWNFIPHYQVKKNFRLILEDIIINRFMYQDDKVLNRKDLYKSITCENYPLTKDEMYVHALGAIDFLWAFIQAEKENIVNLVKKS